MEENAINLIRELPQLTQDLELDSWRAQQKLVYQDARERSSDSTETDPDFPVSVQESPVEVWVGGGLLQGWRY